MKAVIFSFAVLSMIVAESNVGFASLPASYTIIPLEGLPGHNSSTPHDINNEGVVVGISFANFGASVGGGPSPVVAIDPTVSVSWTIGQPTSLDLPSGHRSRAVNEQGNVAGSTEIGGNPHAFYSDGITTTDIHTVGDRSLGLGINNANEVVGYYATPGGFRTAFRWKDGTTISLGTLGGDESTAYDINQSGKIVGGSQTAGGLLSAFIWSDINNNQQSDPGEMIPFNSSGQTASANAVNDSGQAVGLVIENSNRIAAFWSDTSGYTPMGVLPGNSESEAFDVNNLGQAVGFSQGRAFVWDDGELVDLNDVIPQDLGWNLLRGISINDDGWIVGEGIEFGTEKGFLLIPIPEPSTFILAVFVLIGLAGGRWRDHEST